jgi:hypothetical protein
MSSKSANKLSSVPRMGPSKALDIPSSPSPRAANLKNTRKIIIIPKLLVSVAAYRFLPTKSLVDPRSHREYR